jgi:hypothetical protein
MKFELDTNIIPIISNETQKGHSEDNWPMPESSRLLKAYDYLDAVKVDGKYYGYFNSDADLFTATYDKCEDLTNAQIDKITENLNAIS